MPITALPTQFDASLHRQPPSTLRHRLRLATADDHARLDAELGTLDLRDRAGYRRFLEVNAAALLPLERTLAESGVARVFPDWDTRSRSRALMQDLVRIGGTVQPLDAPDRLGFGGILGTMYVLEGSRLGAKVLLGRIERSADPVVTAATAYLHHGAGLQLWPSFLAALERHGRDLGNEEETVAAARRTFGLFAQAAERLHEPVGQAVPT